MPVDLAAIDLNLFLVLDTVLTEGSATAAARRLHVTQSAVSNALARLRELVGDPLVVRRGRGLAPTPVALELAPRIALGLHELRAALARDRDFDPATTTRRFTIALTDNQEVSDLPRIVSRFEQRMPAAALQVVSIERLIASDGLSAGLVDLALAPAALTAPGVRQAPLYTEQAVLVVRRDNRKVGRRLDRAAFEATPYVDVQVAGEPGHGHRLARDALARAGLRRRVVLTVPHFMAAAVAVARTDWITGLPRRFAAEVGRHLPLRRVTAPVEPPSFELAMHWHMRTDADPGARHFRALVAAALADTPARRRAQV